MSEHFIKLHKNEIKVLRQLNNKSIIRYYESFETEKYCFMVMEFANGGTLSELTKKFKKFDEEKAKYIFLKILEALIYLDYRKVDHRDIQMINMVLTSKNEIKLCDFEHTEINVFILYIQDWAVYNISTLNMLLRILLTGSTRNNENFIKNSSESKLFYLIFLILIIYYHKFQVMLIEDAFR